MSDPAAAEQFPAPSEDKQPLSLVYSSDSPMPPLFFKAIFEPAETIQPLSLDELQEFKQARKGEATVPLLTTVLLHCAGVSLEAESKEPAAGTKPSDADAEASKQEAADNAAAEKKAAASFYAHTGSILPDVGATRHRTKEYRAVAKIADGFLGQFQDEYTSGEHPSNMRISDEIYDPTDDVQHAAFELMDSIRKQLGADKVRDADRILRYIMIKTGYVQKVEE